MVFHRKTWLLMFPAVISTSGAMASDCRSRLPHFPIRYAGEFVVERSDGAPCSAVFRETSYTVEVSDGGGVRVILSFHSSGSNPFLGNVVLRGWMNEHCAVEADKMITTGDGTSLFLSWAGQVTPGDMTARVTAQVERNGNMLCTAIASYTSRRED